MAVVKFVDDSTMTISPKSKVIIEDYMYDADKARNKGTVRILEGVVETVIPTTDKLKQKDIQIFTTTAVAGIRGTRMVTVVKPEGTVFYVVPDPKAVKTEKSKIKIRLFSPECRPDSKAQQFVAERLKRKMPLNQLVDEALEARLDPCDVIRAAVMLGVRVEDLVTSFQQVCQADPEYHHICTPCIIFKCTLEALRCLKEVEVAEGQYGILMEKLAPILGEINPKDMDAILKLPTKGSEGPIPGFPPTPEQINQAKLLQEAQQLKTEMIKAGAPEADLQACSEAMGIPTETFAYSPPPTAPPPAAVTGTGLGGGGAPEPTPPPAPVSPFQ